MNLTGYIVKVGTKTGTGKKGPWTLYSFRVAKADGTEFPDWISGGFSPLPFAEGDYVTFDADQVTIKGKQQWNLLPDTAKKVEAPKKEVSAGGAVSATTGGRERTQQQINWQSSRNAALELTKLLLQYDGLPLPAKAKRTEASVYEIIHATVDKLTVEYWNDTESLRKLETVQDAGALVEPTDVTPGDGGDDETDKDAS